MDRYAIMCDGLAYQAAAVEKLADALSGGLRHPSGFSFEPLGAADAEVTARASVDAIKHTPLGGVRVIAMITDARADGGIVEISPNVGEYPDGKLTVRQIANRRGDQSTPVRLHCTECGRDVRALTNSKVAAVIDRIAHRRHLLTTVEYPPHDAVEWLQAAFDRLFGGRTWTVIPFNVFCGLVSGLPKDARAIHSSPPTTKTPDQDTWTMTVQPGHINPR